MVHQAHLRIQRNRATGAIGGDQGAIAASQPPIDLRVLVSLDVEDRDTIELRSVDVARDRIDHRIPPVAGLEARIGCNVETGHSRFLGAIVKCIERTNEVGALLGRKYRIKTLLAPGRAGLVDFEVQLTRDSYERILVGRMKPAATEVEDDVRSGHDGVAASADALAGFEHENGKS